MGIFLEDAVVTFYAMATSLTVDGAAQEMSTGGLNSAHTCAVGCGWNSVESHTECRQTFQKRIEHNIEYMRDMQL